ncbi:MAG: GNAT family N-acetyltransferase [Prevotella sp.]|nr:GNAT family N-acetyltransferase [Prevotella sp.]
MKDYHVDIMKRGEQLPELSERNFFHSPELFHVLERVTGCSPYMVVVSDGGGTVHAHLLAILWRRGSLMPPYLFSQGRVYGEGVYRDETEKKDIFPMMLDAVIKAFHNKLCLFVEFSDLSSKMFGYKAFRQHEFFPVTWMHIHNSLHSLSPEERLSEQTLRTIGKGYNAGIITRETDNDDEIKAFHSMLKNYYRFKPHRYIPSVDFFLELSKSNNGCVYVTLKHERVIGGSAVVYSGNNAYLWFVASRKKSHPVVHPEVLTVWHAIRASYDSGKDHIYFMNVGLPFRTNHYRDFILKFGGKPVSAYRWFHFTIGWINRLLSWVYRE